MSVKHAEKESNDAQRIRDLEKEVKKLKAKKV